MKQTFLPVLLGLDLNAYSVALSFYETYGFRSHAFGRYPCGITENSRFVKTHVVKDMDREEIGVAALFSFARKHEGEELFLVPCSDLYLSLVEKSRDVLKSRFSFFVPPRDVYQKVKNKESFYDALSDAGIPYPKTSFVETPFDIEKVLSVSRISYPAVLKPADSVSYYQHPFPDMQKVYFPKSREEARELALTIYASGYDKQLILQEYVNVQTAATFTVLCGKDKRVRRGILGKILLEEKAPSARGNYAAIVTAPTDDICERLMTFCEKIGYAGVGNFDIVYGNDGNVFVLEMNPRQGRSSDYLRGCGVSLAEFLRMENEGDVYPKKTTYPGVYWRCVAHKTVMEYSKNADLLSLAERYRKNGFSYSPFHQTSDVYFRPIRASYVWIHEKRRGMVFHQCKQAGGVL